MDDRTASLSQGELSTIALEHGVMKLFISRMVREYKAVLVNYIGRCQNYIDSDYDKLTHYWHAELTEAMRRLELPDSELMQFIKPLDPHFITR